MATPRLPIAEAPAAKPEAIFAVERRAVPPDLSYIPDELANYYEAKGMRVSLASSLDNNVARLSMFERFPLYFDEIPPSVAGEKGRNLTRYGFKIDASGLVKKGDCCLFLQSLEARAQEHDAALQTWLEQDSPTSAENTADTINDIFMRDPNAANLKSSRVSVKDAGRLSDHAGRMFG